MRKLILQEFVTIDGFAAGPNDELDFSYACANDSAVSKDSLDFISTIDTIILGDVTYKGFVDFWPSASNAETVIADALNATPKIVFSSHLKEAPWGKWEPARVVSARAEQEIPKVKKLPGKDMVLWGSISLAQSLIKANLIDEYQLRICPVALGKGRELFPKDIGMLNLTLADTKIYQSGLVLLTYRSPK